MVAGISIAAVWASELERFALAKVGQRITFLVGKAWRNESLRVDEWSGLKSGPELMVHTRISGQTVNGSFRKNCGL
ncbi:Uncharacterized protein BM_BM17594 [Brugia malayi]|uniref:Uncharacterized protein n=1 Tax=Brugia malayi TaxID=6279 RepID=A0A4E9FEC5_BRUMA|nr:Uncharacterized protein BM_BM17594 [Brugia malayi]VIO95261.1 Uncharacterized protein BM_BM17594 [Brugia malayi]